MFITIPQFEKKIIVLVVISLAKKETFHINGF